jgi:hypothetical protein
MPQRSTEASIARFLEDIAAMRNFHANTFVVK